MPADLGGHARENVTAIYWRRSPPTAGSNTFRSMIAPVRRTARGPARRWGGRRDGRSEGGRTGGEPWLAPGSPAHRSPPGCARDFDPLREGSNPSRVADPFDDCPRASPGTRCSTAPTWGLVAPGVDRRRPHPRVAAGRRLQRPTLAGARGGERPPRRARHRARRPAGAPAARSARRPPIAPTPGSGTSSSPATGSTWTSRRCAGPTPGRGREARRENADHARGPSRGTMEPLARRAPVKARTNPRPPRSATRCPRFPASR